MNYINTNTAQIQFAKVLKQNIYVDKSLLIEKMNELIGTNDCYVCITRPRRFGKTINANMLAAYYTKDGHTEELFNQLKISNSATYQLHRNQHNVIDIDFSRMPDICNSYEDYITNILNGIYEDLRHKYPQLQNRQYSMLSRMLCDTEDTFIFILDEWDSVFYKKFMTQDDKNSFISFLRNLLKDQPYVDLAYMTGVLPIAKYSSGSELNMFDEYNFMNDNIYDQFFGFGEEEVKQLCGRNSKLSYNELKEWYDGYYNSEGSSLFNPRSVHKALTRGICLNYWTETGPMNEIADCVEHNVDAVREDIINLISGIPVQIRLSGYSAANLQMDTRDEILSAMVVYGFLSYHNEILKIPNRELMEKFESVLHRESMGQVKQIVEKSKEMLDATLNMNQKKVAQILEEIHDREIPFLKYNDENALSCVITLCYLAARDEYYIEREMKSGKGYCDYLFIPRKKDKIAIIIELKVEKSCEEALAQIKDKNYIDKVREYKEVILVGINYSKDKHHECKIEKKVNI